MQNYAFVTCVQDANFHSSKLILHFTQRSADYNLNMRNTHLYHTWMEISLDINLIKPTREKTTIIASFIIQIVGTNKNLFRNFLRKIKVDLNEIITEVWWWCLAIKSL